MKKTITLAALAVSASTSFALIGPVDGMITKKYCLDVYSGSDQSSMAGACDQTANNRSTRAPLGENGCAENQISLETSKMRGERDFPIRIRACLPPNVTQL